MTTKDIQQAVAFAGLDPLSSEEVEKFAQYLALLLKWNAKLNLTAVREPARIIQRHFLDCIQCARVIPKIQTYLDFGSGAGLPGIPVAILRPDLEVTLGESQAKKSAFLRETVRTLNLKARVFDGRIEAMSPDALFDAVSLRAVDKMGEACAAAVRRLSQGGCLILFGTSATEGLLRSATEVITWSDPIPLKGMDDGFLHMGQKTR